MTNGMATPRERQYILSAKRVYKQNLSIAEARWIAQQEDKIAAQEKDKPKPYLLGKYLQWRTAYYEQQAAKENAADDAKYVAEAPARYDVHNGFNGGSLPYVYGGYGTGFGRGWRLMHSAASRVPEPTVARAGDRMGSAASKVIDGRVRHPTNPCWGPSTSSWNLTDGLGRIRDISRGHLADPAVFLGRALTTAARHDFGTAG
jgi:hypothetical protein